MPTRPNDRSGAPVPPMAPGTTSMSGITLPPDAADPMTAE
jgi:hypothetical protein